MDSKSVWEEIDREDIPGYLMDFLNTWLSERDITDVDRHYEMYQSDHYRDDLETLVDNVIEAALEYKNNGKN